MVFNICNVRVEITFFFVAFLTFVLSLKAPSNVLITILSSLLHEAGHFAVMLMVGNKPKSVKFEMVGMNIIRQENVKISTKSEIAISLGGPLVNFIIVILSCGVLCFYESRFILTCACINLILMTFNLLPIKSLDGGATLYFILLQYFESSISGRILKITSAIFIILIYLWAIYVFISTQYNISLIIIAILLTISLFQNNEY